MLTTVLTGVGIMIPGTVCQTADRQLTDRSSGQLSGSLLLGSDDVTNSLTQRFVVLVPALILAAVFGVGVAAAARAQEPVVEPEPVIEASGDTAAIIEAEQAEESASATPVVDPPSRVARLGYIDGDVTIAPAGTDDWAEAALNRPLTSGDRLWVEKDGRAELQIGSAAVYLDGDTGFGFVELDDDVLQASLTEGAATVRVRRLAEGETIQVETPHSTVVLKRVGEYHLEVDKSADRTIVKTRNGEAEVTGGGNQRYTVRDNQRGIFTGLETLSGRIEPLGARTAFENWANDRDARNERSKSAQYVSRDVIGYEDLDDHGEWISEPEYGYVWRPTFISHSWAPYRYGRWVYVSPWGWSWIDDARWGFAPFHYGRWAHIRNRWCWVPGPRHIRPVYAPALVGWVGGPSVGISVSFGNVGWYPLGPRDIFYPGYRYTPRYIRYVNVSNTYFITNNYFYGRRLPPPRFDYRHYPGAITSVSRDHFVGGRRIGDHWVRPDDRQLRNIHAERRPPAIAPYRESVLGGPIRRPPRDADRFGWRHGGDFAGRVPFHRERSAIESNGGRPIGRNQLVDRNGPKRTGDFYAIRPGGGPGVKRPDSERVSGLTGNDRRSGSNLSMPTPRSQARDRQREAREDLHIMRAEESARQGQRRNDHLQRPPSNSFQQGNSSFYRPPERFRDREPSRGTGTVGRSAPPKFIAPAPRSEPRTLSQPRSEPRTLSQPRSEPRSYSPPPRSEPRSYSSPPKNTQPPSSQPRASSSNNNRGSSRGASGASRPSRPNTRER
ncbi:MAG TPA: DUF6600 domain-containing protein [Steroidobacter sp.]|uniref:DUF6600 domain-containing protein n=1 Tax=Steroidobacter sp. TaxID=1978227 RepID=UPI002ED9E9B6